MSNRPNPRKTNGWRRNQLTARVKAAYDTCHLCGRPVDKTLPAGLPGSPEVDEIIPVSRGGSPYDFNNCYLAHRWCNRIRSNHSVEWARREIRRLLDHKPATAINPTSMPLTTSGDW
ncbi:endonuclease [Bifidobacterium tissieri]|uniref:Endonuclease n=1 Tax=Bifidobacterium tissieri TaxID=1630162 RepID=A0A5M9ZVC7_9BIFI|nr:HNH endonuclease signature motif containing protein [Bifidobacterium tissieri]KAA8831455.1 endonuclease [Bifidobacterium tissieri]